MRHCGAIPKRYFTRSPCSNRCCQSPPSWTFAPNLTNSACRGSPHGRTETFGTSSIQQHFASGPQTGTIVPVSVAAWPPKPNVWQPITSAASAQSLLTNQSAPRLAPATPSADWDRVKHLLLWRGPTLCRPIRVRFYRNTIFRRSRFNMQLSGWQWLHRQGAAVTPARSPVRQRAS